ncbi:hypothetical protein CLH39_11835 [Alcaligenes faecalis]|uniref:SHOCT domain-containing protein n=1 Tax=Alcaligenes faecalis TaxID=511 RepID=UPI001934178E|nr:SHOCT domain-containing protein [Alcaligenes faecalis]QRF90879.1 hypothetical protein CLH39_11835 [Alcaligenes faecalis]
MGVADEIRKLADLKRDGWLTDEEFYAQKRLLLRCAEDEASTDKDTAFYGASIAAWLNYGLELNKQILLFSSGGIALLLGLVSSEKFLITGPVLLISYACAVSFLVSMVSVLIEFKRSRTYIFKMLSGELTADRDCVLTWLGRVSVLGFGMGVICLTAFVALKIN